MAFFKAKVPVALATGIICLLVGGGLGAVTMTYVELGNASHPGQLATEDGKAPDAKGPGGAKGPDAKGGGKGGGNKGGKGGGAPGGGAGVPKGPSPKMQLSQLVTKLDILTRESLHVELTPDQKKQIKDLLAGLEAKEAITDEEAKEKFDALIKLLEGNKKTLEDAGYRWPGAGAGGFGGAGAAPPPNPFSAGDPATHLKTLQATVSK